MNSINFILCHQNQTRSKDMDLIESVTIQLLRKEKILSKIVFQDYEHLSQLSTIDIVCGGRMCMKNRCCIYQLSWWRIQGSKISQTELLGQLTPHDESGRNVILMVVDLSRFDVFRYKHLDHKDPKAQINFFTIQSNFQML